MLTFAYACPVKYGNPMGNRISKTVTDMTGKKAPFTTYYTRDAQGNTMAVYDNSYYKSDFVACEIDRATYQEIYNNLQQIKEEAMQSEEPNHYQNLLEHYIRNRWQEDSCRYKYIQKLGATPLPCLLPSEYYSLIQQLYYQDFEYLNSLGEEEKRAYFRTKYNEYYGQMGEYTLCFTQELEKAFTQPQETFEDWNQAQQNTPFEEKVEQFFVEFQQIPINYGTTTDTAYQDSLYWKEQHLYGSSRLGIAKPELEVTNYTPSNASSLTTNFKNYELTNHLGNILATIKDEKQQIDQNADGIVDYYEPIVITANDYYPFGMVMPNRSFSLAGSGYRFGFNGKENDNDLYGTGNAIDFGARVHDARIGRFLSTDPRFIEFQDFTTYGFAANNPIQFMDENGEGPSIASWWAMKASQKVINWVVLKHKQGMANIQMAEQARQMEVKYTGSSSITKYTKALTYIAPIWNSTAPMSDANDASVLTQGKNLDGSKAGKVDYAFAGVGLFIPFANGGMVKQVLKNFEKLDLNIANKVFSNSDDFYKMTNKTDVGERIGIYKQKAQDVANNNGWSLNENLSKKNNNRMVYSDADGNNYSLDTRHGTFEVSNSKGKHQGEVNFFGEKTKAADNSGKHDLKVK